jgi:hypothetical protein
VSPECGNFKVRTGRKRKTKRKRKESTPKQGTKSHYAESIFKTLQKFEASTIRKLKASEKMRDSR